MKPFVQTKNSNARIVAQEKNEAREIWHKLVVKVLIWKEGLTERGMTGNTNKIARSEWDTYYQQILKINVTQSKDKVLEDLNLTLEKIKQHGGFDDK